MLQNTLFEIMSQCTHYAKPSHELLTKKKTIFFLYATLKKTFM